MLPVASLTTTLTLPEKSLAASSFHVKRSPSFPETGTRWTVIPSLTPVNPSGKLKYWDKVSERTASSSGLAFSVLLVSELAMFWNTSFNPSAELDAK